jgi:hypothetical protein
MALGIGRVAGSDGHIADLLARRAQTSDEHPSASLPHEA